MHMKKLIAASLAAGMLLNATPVLAEEAETITTVDTQKLDASYTLALNSINAEDYEKAKEYLNVCFAYCDPQSNPTLYADLLLKQACIDVIEENSDMALLNLDAALRVQPDLADAYLVRTQVYATQGNVDAAIENLEKYIELTEDTSLYETVAQLQEANGNMEAAQAAYDKYVEGAGAEIEEAGFQSGLYKMQAGQLEEAITDFEAYAEDETYGAGAAYNIGICKMNLGDYAGAIEAFNTCEEKDGEFEGLLYNRGVCNLLSEQWEAAAADFEKSIESEPYVDDARYNLAICQMQQEDYETAAATFTELIGDGGTEETATEDTEAEATEEAAEDAEAEATEEAAAEDAGAEATEEAAAEDAEAEATEETAAEDAGAEDTETEETATENNETEATEDTETRVVNDGAYYYRAVCYTALGNMEAALADYTTCIDHGYELAQSYYQRAQVYAALGDTENQNSDLQASLSVTEAQP